MATSRDVVKCLLLSEVLEEEDVDNFEVFVEDSELMISAAAALAAPKESDVSGASVEKYYEVVIPSYTPSEFHSHFRMSRQAVQYICDKLMQRLDRSTYSSVPVDKQVLLTIWTLANPEAFRSIGDRFGFANRGMAHYCFMSTCRRITDTLYSDSVLWPSTVDCRRNADEFEKQYGFPGVVGCIDGCHIPIKAPVTDRDSYVNRKGFTSVNFLGVCDHRMKFIYAYTDCPGSVHDARVLDVSSLKQKLSEDSGFNVEHYHLLGDAAYPLLPGLMVPVRDNGHLTQAQVRYNALHSAARAVVERCFGRLKGKFRRLKSLDVTRTDYSSVIIETCIVLHNICLDDEFDESSSVDDVADDDVECDSTDQSAPADHRRADKAKLKRDRIMNAL